MLFFDSTAAEGEEKWGKRNHGEGELRERNASFLRANAFSVQQQQRRDRRLG